MDTLPTLPDTVDAGLPFPDRFGRLVAARAPLGVRVKKGLLNLLAPVLALGFALVMWTLQFLAAHLKAVLFAGFLLMCLLSSRWENERRERALVGLLSEVHTDLKKGKVRQALERLEEHEMAGIRADMLADARADER